MAKSEPNFQQPRWWSDAHNAAWEHVREAFRNKWEERQAAEPSAEAAQWDEAEPAIRFGFGRRRVPAGAAEPPVEREERPDWDPELEATLQQEWDSMHHAPDEGSAPRLWHDIRQFVHRGWFGP